MRRGHLPLGARRRRPLVAGGLLPSRRAQCRPRRDDSVDARPTDECELGRRIVKDQSRYSSLRDYLQVLRAQLWVIVLLTLLGGGVAYFLSAQQEEKYTATASISFEEETSSTERDRGRQRSERESSRADAAGPRADNQERRHGQGRPGQARQADPGRQPAIGDHDIARRRNVPRRCDRYLERGELRRQARQPLRPDRSGGDQPRVARPLRDQPQGHQPPARRARSRGSGRPGRVQRLDQPADATAVPRDNAKPATISQVAVTPAAPTSPKPLRNTLIGLLLGLVIGILVAFLRESLDQRLHGPGEVKALLPYPIVGHLGNDAMGKVLHGEGGSAADRDGIEQIQILRQNLYFLDVDNPPKVILVTSALPEEGKSTVAASLAHAAAALRRPDPAARMRPAPAGARGTLRDRAGARPYRPRRRPRHARFDLPADRPRSVSRRTRTAPARRASTRAASR